MGELAKDLAGRKGPEILEAMRGEELSRPYPDMDFDARLARAKFRAWHRGTREADFMIGGFFDRYHAEWGEKELDWFEALLDEDDVDIMAWALEAQPVPPRISRDR